MKSEEQIREDIAELELIQPTLTGERAVAAAFSIATLRWVLDD